MIERIPAGYAERAILGDSERQVDLVKKIDETAIALDKLLNPIDDAARKKVNGTATRLIRKLGAASDNVTPLMETLNDRNKTDLQKEKAEGILDTLAKSTYIAMRYGGNQEVLADLCSGSAEKINDRLPEPMKGLGERIRLQIIDEPKILEVLNELDRKRLRAKKAGVAGDGILAGEIGKSLTGLLSLDVDSTKEDQLGMVIAFLGVEKEKMEGESVTQDNAGIDTRRRKPVVVGTSRDEYSGTTYGAPEGMNRIGPMVIPEKDMRAMAEKMTPEQAHNWMIKTMVDLSENPLFFANWWQSNTAEQLISMLNSRLDYGTFSEKYGDLKKDVYANLAVLGMQSVDRNADANPDNYSQFAPPKNMAAELHWDDGGEKYEILKRDPVIRGVLEKMFSDAFSFDNGWKVVKAFSDGKTYATQNEYIGEILGAMGDRFKGQDRDVLIAKGRVAMAVFEVEWMPEWIRWANENKRAWTFPQDPANRGPEVAWLAGGFNQDPNAPWEKYAYSGRLKTTKCPEPGRGEYELGYDHPRVLRPWEVASGAKDAYRHRPEIIYRMDALLTPFIAVTLKDKTGTRWPRASQESILDKYLKYGKLMTEIMGGPQGLELDNLTTLEKAMPLAANFWGASKVNSSPEFGKFLAGLFALKTDAMFFPGYRSNAKTTLNAIRGLDIFSGEAEKQKALEGAIGPKGNFAHGWVAEAKRLYNIDLLATDARGVPVYQEFVNAYLRVFMDTPDLAEARKTYDDAVRYLTQNVYLTLAGGAAGILKTISSIK